MNLLVSAVLGYLLGSVPFAVIVSRAFRLADPRSFGSGNPGATNVLRSGSKAAALLTLLGDAAKGWLAMLVAAKVGAGDTAVAVAGLAAFLGHVFPFTLGFAAARAWRPHWECCLASPGHWRGSLRRSGWRWSCSRAIRRWGRWRRRRRRR
jgi:acyl-phosphate glycerol 3-phosphate acyltransferase